MIDLLDGDIEKAETIEKIKSDISRYGIFSRAIKLGITYGKRDLKFTDFFLFDLIKEAIENG